MFLAGVASAEVPGAWLWPQIQAEKGAGPSVGESHRAQVGERVYAEYVEPVVRVLTIDGPLTAKKRLVFPRGTEFVFCGYKLPLNAESEAWCTSTLAGRGSFHCFFDATRDGEFESMLAGSGVRKGLAKPAPPGKIVARPATRAERDGFGGNLPANFYRKELLYQGAAGGVLRLLYREFTDDMIRPAFTQELTFSLAESGPTIAGFGSARIEVAQAGNEGIEYRVLSGF